MELLRPLLPAKYSPLQPDGRGLQGVYLTELPEPFALELAHLVGSVVEAIARAETVAYVSASNAESIHPELALWEEHLRKTIEDDPNLPATDREAIVLARRGAGWGRGRGHIAGAKAVREARTLSPPLCVPNRPSQPL